MIIEKLCTLLAISDNDSNEYIISSYFLSNWNRIIEVKMRDVLKEIGVSKSTLTRYCQLLGYKNFTEVQYELFFEMSSTQKYKSNIVVEKDDPLINLIEGKKRIIIVGDGLSLSPLLFYKPIFLNISIDFEVKLTDFDTVELLENYKIKEEDIIIYVSLYQNNLELLMNTFKNYTQLLNYVHEKNSEFIYIGKVANANEKGIYSIPIISGLNKSQEIYELCNIFEKIYSILEKS